MSWATFYLIDFSALYVCIATLLLISSICEVHSGAANENIVSVIFFFNLIVSSCSRSQYICKKGSSYSVTATNITLLKVASYLAIIILERDSVCV